MLTAISLMLKAQKKPRALIQEKNKYNMKIKIRLGQWKYEDGACG